MDKAMPEIARQFAALELDNHDFTHRDHVNVAYELLSFYDYLDAVSIYARTIREMARHDNIPEKFNTTITFAFMGIIAERIEGDASDSFEDFSLLNPDLLNRNILNNWYTNEQLHSDKARKIFLMPETERTIDRMAQGQRHHSVIEGNNL